MGEAAIKGGGKGTIDNVSVGRGLRCDGGDWRRTHRDAARPYTSWVDESVTRSSALHPPPPPLNNRILPMGLSGLC